MNLRNAAEQVLRAWDRYEVDRQAPPVIDYDCTSTEPDVTAAPDRLWVHRELAKLRSQADEAGDQRLAQRLGAHDAYLSAVLGQRLNLSDYIRATQGCGSEGWSRDHGEERLSIAQRCLADVGVPWSASTTDELSQIEKPLDAPTAADAIREAASRYEPQVRSATGATASFDLSVQLVTVDAYWSYWLDGKADQVRLRLNLRRSTFTEVRARQFALHEVLGHGLQGASYAQRCADESVPWIRFLSVHAQQQVLLEGLAQALPLFVAKNDEMLVARVRLDHYLQLVRAELHLKLNAGMSVQECAETARTRVPFWTDDDIADMLTDRGADPLLRTYLWAYAAGIDWFSALADDADHDIRARVLSAAYRDPLTPTDLATLWPAGPTLGGPGAE